MYENIVRLLSKYGMNFVNGLGTTLLLAFISVAIGCVIGAIVAIMKLAKNKPLNFIATVYIEIIRDTPLLLQLYFFYFLLPDILPAMCNEFVAVTKETSLASTFYVGDLMTQYQTISGKTYLVLEPLIIIGVIYFVVTFTMSKLVALLEKKLKEGD